MNINVNLGLIQMVADEIRSILGDDFDDETFLTTLDGECDFMDLIGALVRERVEAMAFEAASKDAAQTYNLRAKRMSERQTAINKALGKLLDAAKQTTVKHPLATVTRTKPRQHVEVIDPNQVPTQLCRMTPDKSAIGKALEAGEKIPGVELRHGEPGIMVKVR